MLILTAQLVEGLDMEMGGIEFEKKNAADETRFEGGEEGGVAGEDGADATAGEEGTTEEGSSSPTKARTMRATQGKPEVTLSQQEIAQQLIKNTSEPEAVCIVTNTILNIAGALESNRHIHECYKNGELYFNFLVRVQEEERVKAALVIQQQQRDRMEKKKKKKLTKGRSGRGNKKSPKKK